LARAAEAQGSTQALASLLRVPENTLLRWMKGRAQMPLQAFLALIEVLSRGEQARNDTLPPAPPSGERLTFRMGELHARCARCDGIEFVAAQPERRLAYTAKVACCSCGEGVVHGNLIGQLAKDAVQHSRAMSAARARRQAEAQARSSKSRVAKRTVPGPKYTQPDDSSD
jgi:hypothetical protein